MSMRSVSTTTTHIRETVQKSLAAIRIDNLRFRETSRALKLTKNV